MNSNRGSLARLWILPAFIAAFLACAGIRADDLAAELPRIKPLEPAAALGSFVIQPGFELVLAAAEPLVASPVDACYDADLRLYVVEMKGYPFPEQKPSGGVVRLVDRDGDGRFDERTQFLDDLSWPTSVTPYDGGVFVIAAPDLIYAKDSDGDGRADVRKVIFTGFGTGNVQGLANGLKWGPDGWIHGVAGINGGTITCKVHPEWPAVDVRGRDFRFRPDLSAFETSSGGGQFGQTYDDWGRRFTCSNSNHARQVVLPLHPLERNRGLVTPPVTVDIAAEGPAGPVFRISKPEPWRVVRTRQRAADPVMSKRLPPAELVATGFFTSATGITVYRGTAFPREYQGNIFVGDVGGNLVHRKQLSWDGVVARATRADAGREFLASTDNWFRPVNFTETPQGTLLILDMYRETIEHPVSIPEPIKKHLDLKSGMNRGRIYELVPAGWKRKQIARLSSATTAGLVAHLADGDAWPRETARRLLLERVQAEALGLLREMVRTRPSALARINAIWTLDALNKLDLDDLRRGIEDVDARVREASARVAARRVGRDSTVAALVAGLANDAEIRVRMEAAFALGAWQDPHAIPALAKIAAHDPASPWIRAAVLSSVARRENLLLDAFAQSGFLGQSHARPWITDLAELVGFWHEVDQVNALAFVLDQARLETGEQARAVLALARGWSRAGGDPRAILKTRAGPSVERVLNAVEKSLQERGAGRSRADAVALVGLLRQGDARQLLLELIDPQEPPDVEIAALRALRGFMDAALAREVVPRLKAMSPAVKGEAVETLFSRKGPEHAVLEAVEAGTLDAREIEPGRWAALEARDASISGRVRAIRARLGMSDRAAVVTTYARALTPDGDPARGKTIFLKSCATCHVAEGQGREVGPNLATVAHRAPGDLLVHILDPNREVAANAVNYLVATRDGRLVSGIIASESASTITLKRAEAATDIVSRDQIESITSTRLSLMPEGLEKDLDPRAVSDVIAYLRSLVGKPAGK